LADRVADYIPEFAQHGKEWVTLRHVLTHRAGIPTVPDAGEVLHLLGDSDAIIARPAAAQPVSETGRREPYNAVTGRFVLGEVVKRVTGKTIRQVLAEEILEPLGFRWMNYGVRPDDVPRVAVNAFTGPPPPWPMGGAVTRALGVDIAEATRISNTP